MSGDLSLINKIKEHEIFKDTSTKQSVCVGYHAVSVRSPILRFKSTLTSRLSFFTFYLTTHTSERYPSERLSGSFE